MLILLKEKKKRRPIRLFVAFNDRIPSLRFNLIEYTCTTGEDFARKNSLRVCETKLVKKQWARRIRCFQEAAREAKLFRSSCKRGSAHWDNFLNALDHSTYPR